VKKIESMKCVEMIIRALGFTERENANILFVE